MATVKAVSSGASLAIIINYITNEAKFKIIDKETGEVYYERHVSGINCSPETAIDEMKETKEAWGKPDGRQYKHYTFNFHKDEKVTAEQAHNMAKEVLEKHYPGHEIILSTHMDTKGIHTHGVVNSVNFETGIKLQEGCKLLGKEIDEHGNVKNKWGKSSLQEMKDSHDKLCIREGLTIAEKGKDFYGNPTQQVSHYGKPGAFKLIKEGLKKRGVSWQVDMMKDVLEVKSEAVNREDFISKMNAKGYDVNWRSEKATQVTFSNMDNSKERMKNTTMQKVFDGQAGLDIKVSKEDFERSFENNRLGIKEKPVAEKQPEQIKTEAPPAEQSNFLVDMEKLTKQYKADLERADREEGFAGVGASTPEAAAVVSQPLQIEEKQPVTDKTDVLPEKTDPAEAEKKEQAMLQLQKIQLEKEAIYIEDYYNEYTIHGTKRINSKYRVDYEGNLITRTSYETKSVIDINKLDTELRASLDKVSINSFITGLEQAKKQYELEKIKRESPYLYKYIQNKELKRKLEQLRETFSNLNYIERTGISSYDKLNQRYKEAWSRYNDELKIYEGGKRELAEWEVKPNSEYSRGTVAHKESVTILANMEKSLIGQKEALAAQERCMKVFNRIDTEKNNRNEAAVNEFCATKRAGEYREKQLAAQKYTFTAKSVTADHAQQPEAAAVVSKPLQIEVKQPDIEKLEQKPTLIDSYKDNIAAARQKPTDNQQLARRNEPQNEAQVSILSKIDEKKEAIPHSAEKVDKQQTDRSKIKDL